MQALYEAGYEGHTRVHTIHMAHNDGDIFKGGGETGRIKGLYQEREALAKNNMLKLPNSIIYNQLITSYVAAVGIASIPCIMRWSHVLLSYDEYWE